ncbi:lycopene cyclase domain-containing protein [Cellulomonas sp. NS3]|uniref:lycopene cyclase domain-containing protein n=1 Tax=Cellulomonas sp. NS3 TaxID=2973977 RepID=UPI002161D568|nr:lycopene cyclase domain-containing protein [Cellulomonas sp. NS3]
MIGLAYLGALLVSIGGIALLDRAHRLAFWSDWRLSAACVGIGVAAFLAWDLAGLALGIFARGDSPHMTGILLAPELPIEEVGFLTLLCYTALAAWRAFDRWVAERRGAAPGASRPSSGSAPGASSGTGVTGRTGPTPDAPGATGAAGGAR